MWHHLTLAYTASNQTLTLTKLRDGLPYGITNTVALGAAFTDFRLNTVAIASYSDAGQGAPQFSGSILAHGVVEGLSVQDALLIARGGVAEQRLEQQPRRSRPHNCDFCSHTYTLLLVRGGVKRGETVGAWTNAGENGGERAIVASRASARMTLFVAADGVLRG